jgi:hypothetical protein
MFSMVVTGYSTQVLVFNEWHEIQEGNCPDDGCGVRITNVECFIYLK